MTRRPLHRDAVAALAIWCFSLQGLCLSALLTALKYRADTPPAAPAPAPAEAGSVRQGDLVTPGPGVVAPRLTRRPTHPAAGPPSRRPPSRRPPSP